MKLYIYEDYRQMFPELKGTALTDRLITETLCEEGLRDRDIHVSRDSRGKPRVILTDGNGPAGASDRGRGDIHISVSHSGAYFVCLLSDSPVGVDVQVGRSVRYDAVSRRYFTAEEREIVRERGEEGFLFLWTRKEAYAKYKGTGIAEILKGTSVIGRSDTVFTDIQLEEGVYCSCCEMLRTEKKDTPRR